MILYSWAFFFFFVKLKTIQVYKSYIYIEREVKLRENLIRFQIEIQLKFNFTLHVPSNQNF